MISVKSRPGPDQVWKDRLCCDCIYFQHLPFTVGRCARKDKAYPPSITEERARAYNVTRCGPKAQFFTAKRQAA